MQTTFDPSSPFTLAILIALLVLLTGQVILIFRSRAISPGRKAVRAGLNGLLWLLALAYILQPVWPVTQPATHALVVGADVPGAMVRRLKDSLRIRDSFTALSFKSPYDSVTLVGQDFPTEILTGLSSAALQWIPYNAPEQVRNLHWKGVVRQGEMQQVTGRIFLSEKRTLAVRFGTQLLDSLTLNEGENEFTLRFPAFAQGRTQTELVLNGRVLDTLRFFSRPLKPLRVQLLLSSPDFESKTLADWLGRHGHTVQLTATLSKDVRSDVRINPDNTPGSPDLLITEPASAGTAAVRKAVASGQAVLFVNLTEPEADCRTIGRFTGTRWPVRRVSTEPAIALGNGLTALPYRFADAMNLFPAAGYPVAVQRVATPTAGKQKATGRVGVSLLNETFQLALSGDSLTYSRVWTSALAQLYPTPENNLLVDAPVFGNLRQTILLNNPSQRVRTATAGADTIRFAASPLNERSVEGMYLPTRTGWQTLGDSAAIYVSDRSSYPHESIRRFMLAHAQQRRTTNQTTPANNELLPNWVWLTLFLVVFSALWIEPKLG